MKSSSHPGAFHVLDALASCGLRDVVVSPGSRHAPLVIAAEAHAQLRVTIALDERTAGYVALGMGLSNRIPAVVISTSGTAAVNHGPAIAEAHFQRTPLISITADRPVGRRHEGLGQVVLQQHLFQAHALWEGELDETRMSESVLRSQAQQAWNAASCGPVHINIPFEEPLYELREWEDVQDEADLEPAVLPEEMTIPEDLLDHLCTHDPRVLVLLGAHAPDSTWAALSSVISNKVATFVDVFSQVRGEDLDGSAERVLAGLSGVDLEELKPHCIISAGLPPMSKALRKKLASFHADHWHIGSDGEGWDLFGQGVQQWKVPAPEGMMLLLDSLPEYNAFAAGWNVLMDRIHAVEKRVLASFDMPWSDWSAFSALSRALGVSHPLGALHFANSTSARYAQWFPWNAARLHANRGVAGIDGCLSTAVGDARMHPDHEVVLITGDSAWLYDLNGLMVKPMPVNLKVIVINNGGGNIFHWLNGPKEVGMLESHFEVPFLKDAASSAALVGLAYFRANDAAELENVFDAWSNNKAPALLEIQTPGATSSRCFQELQEALGKEMQTG